MRMAADGIYLRDLLPGVHKAAVVENYPRARDTREPLIHCGCRSNRGSVITINQWTRLPSSYLGGWSIEA